MKYIQKDREPECFTAWKNLANDDWKPTYSVLQNPEKKEIHCSLIREQGHICCYCQSRIARPTSHIEHFRPKSAHRTEQLRYENLLASCNCGEKRAGLSECEEPITAHEIEEVSITHPKHCGEFKGDWHDEELVSPLDPSCETYFLYGELTGRIQPTNNPERTHAASVTIEGLGLNSVGLVRRRKEAFAGVLYDLDSLSYDEGRMLIDGYKRKNDQGRCAPFCAAIVNVLDKCFPST